VAASPTAIDTPQWPAAQGERRCRAAAASGKASRPRWPRRRWPRRGRIL